MQMLQSVLYGVYGRNVTRIEFPVGFQRFQCDAPFEIEITASLTQ